MIITRRIRLTSPILASRPHRGDPPRRTFDRVKAKDDNGSVKIKTYLERWNWAFLEARDALDFGDVSVSAIIPAPFFEVRSTSTYHRKNSGNRAPEAFESIPSGTVLTWQFTLSDHLPPHAEDHPRFVRPPSEQEFDAMLAHIGEHLGMSFWGHGHLYGTFIIQPPQ